jgi:hypothetical protein
MLVRALTIVAIASAAVGTPSPIYGQVSERSAHASERAIRQDIPLTNAIRRAFAAGTRDSTGRPGQNYWQLQVDYTIEARLDPATSRVTATETVVLYNRSDTDLRAIHLRLDQNMFAPNAVRLEPVPEITDGMVVTRITVDGEEVDLDPPPRLRFFGGPEPPATTLAAYDLDETNASVTLPTPIAPGAQATLEVDWNFKVPLVADGRGQRMGSWGDSVFQVAQWYPRVAVYDDLRGWNVEPYLGPSEFYNNFGRFDVTIDVPAGWLVGATGVLRNPEAVLSARTRERLGGILESDDLQMIVGPDERGAGNATLDGDRLRWRFVADTVNDFAWATSAAYIWEATRAHIPERGPIPVHLLYPPESKADFDGAAEATVHALAFYSDLWMPYAFPQMTLADGPERGMEYPMFLMSARGAADHEVGHEWWPMMVGTNETWYGFMDEGFDDYMGELSDAHRDGEEPNLDGSGQSYGLISGLESEAPLMWNANYGGPMYGFQAYRKATPMLSMLGGIVGDTAVWDAMSDYAKAWRFKHPSPWDYAFLMSEALGQDLGWFWYYWLFTTDAVDGAIQDVHTAGGRTTVTVHQAGQMPSPVVLKVRLASGGPAVSPMPNSEMLDDSTAVVTFPVDVWFSGSRTFDAVLDFGGRAVEKVLLDPRCRFPDGDVTDNMWPRDTEFATREGNAVRSWWRGPTCYGSDGW